MDLTEKYLHSICKTHGASLVALCKKAPTLAATIVGRATLTYLESRPDSSFGLPVVSNVLCKSGNTYSGAISGGEEVFDLLGVDATRVAAAIVVSLGLSTGTKYPPNSLAALASSVDQIVKSDLVKSDLVKSDLVKASQHGAAGADTNLPAAAIPPVAPAQPTPTEKFRPAGSKPKKKTSRQIASIKPVPASPSPPPKADTTQTLKLALSESRRPCSLCGGTQFNKGEFVGCLCTSPLADRVSVELTPTGLLVKCKNFDADELDCLKEVLHAHLAR